MSMISNEAVAKRNFRAEKKSFLDNIRQLRFALLPSAVTEDACDLILANAWKAKEEGLAKFPMNLNDSDDVGNQFYRSKRSPNMNYCYLKTKEIMEISRKIAYFLSEITGHDWFSNINEHCLPIFEYEENGCITPHRGRDIGYGANTLVAVLMLTKPGVDFNEGRFFLNTNATASEDGKEVYEYLSSRRYFDLDKGSIIIFDNEKCIHGTEPVKMADRAYRVTVSWRIEC